MALAQPIAQPRPNTDPAGALLSPATWRWWVEAHLMIGLAFSKGSLGKVSLPRKVPKRLKAKT